MKSAELVNRLPNNE